MNVLGDLGGGAGIAGLAAATLTWLSSRSKERFDRRTETSKLNVEATDAETRRFAEILDGYRDQVEGLQAALAAAEEARREDNQEMHRRLDVLDRENGFLRERNEAMLVHMSNLERMIPNPPGPPKRPWLI